MSSVGFVDIRTVYDLTDRSVEALEKIYDDAEYLQSLIKELIDKNIPTSSFTGKKVLLKPNWVRHPLNEADLLCLTTHESFIIATIEVILKMNPQTITVGDAPIQGCNWDKMISSKFISKIKDLSETSGIDISVLDFRRVKFDPDKNIQVKNILELERFLIFDLGKESYLEPITLEGENKFRVTQYDPDRFKESHTVGMHKYCITKELFESDIVISLPKSKTHQKAGITAALKNIVGFNGDKDFLPHHRIGGTKMGGDSYPGWNFLRHIAELFYDKSYKSQGSWMYRTWVRMGSLFWKLSQPGKVHQVGAAWHGNDTVWRMVMDLNKIVVYGRSDGSIAQKPVRELYSLCDGIVGGQGDGPLHPDPLALGVVSFTNDSAWHDLCQAELMQLDYRKISLLKAAKNFRPDRKVTITLNGNKITVGDLSDYSINATPPPGWVDHLN